MRKVPAVLLLIVLLSCIASCAAAQSIVCPEAHIVLTVPDSWIVVPLSGTDDPDLCLLLEGGDLSLSVYVAYSAGMVPDAFQVFTGNETESGTVTLGGKEMTYTAGRSPEGDYRIYTWLDRQNQVQMYFLVTGNLSSARSSISSIMNSLVFQ